MQFDELINKKFKKISFSKERLINNSDSCLVICLGEYKIVCDTFIRIYRQSQILLLNTDIHLNNRFCPLPNDVFYGKNCYRKSLLHTSVKKLNKLCKKSFVKKIELSENADLLIELSNNVSIELLVCVQIQDFIYYQIYHKHNLKAEKRFDDILIV